MPSAVWAIVVAAGSGSRFGKPKQFEVVHGRRVLDWSVDLVRSVALGVVVVASEVASAAIEAGSTVNASDNTTVVIGGATRSASVRAGLAAVPESAQIIVVHDAARPLASPRLLHAVIEAVEQGADAAIPGIPVVDTIKRVHNVPVDPGGAPVIETVDRSELVAVQTPQAFSAVALRRAHLGEPDASDDAGVVESLGGQVVVVPGETTNLKITVPHDLVIAEALFSHLTHRAAMAGL